MARGEDRKAAAAAAEIEHALDLGGIADQRGGFRDRIGGAVGKDEFFLRKAAHGVAGEIEERQQFTGADLGRLAAAWLRFGFRAPGHQDLVQRAAAASSWLFASTQLVPRALSS